MSTPLSAGSLAREGDAAAQAAYLEHFRAPDIVADAEAVRATLLAGSRRPGGRAWGRASAAF
ncbi:hypothetical protein A5N15_08280 [Rothia kristinae]|uniref:Uncharacterized protein n=1 Tax=Rothia kristinae TaxID=37923 RepID=A0A657IU53_9MICC|nr:hypothetical protein A5N15_08280 [Rothia kristinae]